MLISPFLLGLNIAVEVILATNSIITFFSATASTIQYIFTGKYLVGYTIIIFFISMIASFIGFKISFFCIRKFNKMSVIILNLGSIILASTVALTIISAFDIKEQVDNNISLGFKDFCNN